MYTFRYCTSFSSQSARQTRHQIHANPMQRKTAAAINLSSRNNHTGDSIVQSVKTPGIRNKLAGKKTHTQHTGPLHIHTRKKKSLFFDANPISETTVTQ